MVNAKRRKCNEVRCTCTCFLLKPHVHQEYFVPSFKVSQNGFFDATTALEDIDLT